MSSKLEKNLTCQYSHIPSQTHAIVIELVKIASDNYTMTMPSNNSGSLHDCYQLD